MDKQAQHTPGPWYKISGDPIEQQPFAIYTNPPGEYSKKIAEGFAVRPNDEDEANGRLMAASPDLLEALEDAYAMILLMGISTEHKEVQAMGTAIARAKGEESA